MKNIQINSKFIKPGDIFVAIPCKGVKANIFDALQNGAELVFAERNDAEQCDIKNIVAIPDARLIASKLSRFIYPNQPEICIAVTGTNGKSSVAHFLSQIWTYSGITSANLGTLGLFINQEAAFPNEITIPNLTTPDPVTFHKIMEYLVSQKVNHCVFEASSHALEQKRCHSATLTAAAFTNLASDHLDYHKTKEVYFATKLKLFQDILPPDRPAIVSMDFPEIYQEVSKYNHNIITFGMNDKNFVKAKNIQESSEKIVFDLVCGNELFPQIEIKLLGTFQVMNILCAVALALTSGLNPSAIADILPKIKSLNGRMEHIRTLNGGNVYVDFAHTADGLKNALKCFRKVCRGRLICVFGCGGNRDITKRPEMGRIASQLADICVVTDDNPRQEMPEEIRKQIIASCPNAIEIGNRHEAINHALSIIHPGDIVAIMGKGHETYQIYGTTSTHFSDKEKILAF